MAQTNMEDIVGAGNDADAMTTSAATQSAGLSHVTANATPVIPPSPLAVTQQQTRPNVSMTTVSSLVASTTGNT